MRLRPAQIGVLLICGRSIPHRAAENTLAERIQEGRRWLVEITGQDFGFDLQRWHDYMKESRDGGYTYGRNIMLPKIMQAALQSARWQKAVRCLNGTTRDAERRPVRSHAERGDEDEI
jgi:hypothetical protein